VILRLVVAATLVYLIGPIILITLYSFHATPSLALPFTGLSLRWYADVFANAQLLDALVASLAIALATALVTLVLGSFAALAWPRLGGRERRALEILCLTPIALPGLFLGVALLALFAQAKVQLSAVTIVLSHVVFALPPFFIAVRARLSLFDQSLEEAARDLGATPMQTLRLVTLPILAPTLFAAALMAFALSFDEFVVTAFVSGTETTLPLFVWSMMRRTVTPLINAVSVLTLAFTLVILAAAYLVGHLRRSSALGRRLADA
jgi:spermidine/putrescine transport system permease protein